MTKTIVNKSLLTFKKPSIFLVLLVIFYRLYVRTDTPGVCIVRGGGREGEGGGSTPVVGVV